MRARRLPADVRERKRTGRTRVARGIVFVALSPLAFQLAVPLAGVLGIAAAKWLTIVIGFALAATGTKRVVVGAFEIGDAAHPRPRGELPEARVVPPGEV
jgi:hypothetical protein